MGAAGRRPADRSPPEPPRPESVIRDVAFQFRAFADLRYWIVERPRIALKLLDLIEEARRDPFGGRGKPEPLKGELRGCWSRRITGEHRLVYRVTDSAIVLLQARYHY